MCVCVCAPLVPAGPSAPVRRMGMIKGEIFSVVVAVNLAISSRKMTPRRVFTLTFFLQLETSRSIPNLIAFTEEPDPQ